jgi:protein-S-isoprenylcysteine O-methyltransferase Ste14
LQAAVETLEFNVQKDFGKYFGSAMMIGFGVLALYRWYQTQLLFFLLLVLRDFAAGYFFLKRNEATEKAALFPSSMAYVSSAIPLLYFGPIGASKAFILGADLLSIVGFLMVAFATLELGTSIGIAPANRGPVRSGIYRRIKHPMYTGYVLSEVGLVLLNPLNAVLFLVSTILYFIRAGFEQKILKTQD